MTAKFHVFVSSKNNQYYFNLKSANGEIILQSEGYVQRDGCLNGVQSVKDNSQEMSRYLKKISGDNRPYFVLTAANGQIIGVSQMYASAGGRDIGILAVMSAAPDAEIVS